MDARAEFLLGPIDRSARIIEIGAGYSPIAPKREGWNTKVVDVGTQADLIEKYSNAPGVDVDRIEEVDFVWRDGQLSDAVPSTLHGTFDAFIASHVIEHTPDLVTFLDGASSLLADTGIVILAIPDKRFCFDYFRPLATTGDILASRLLRRTRHSKQAIFDHLAYAVSANGGLAWGQHPVEHFTFHSSIELAHYGFINSSEDAAAPYFDVHAWQFTPASFQLIILELARLRHTDWQVDRVGPAVGFEFFVWLRRGGGEAAAALSESELNARRLHLLKSTLLETKEQIEFLTTVQAD